MPKNLLFKFLRLIAYGIYLLSLSLVFLYDAGLSELRSEKVTAKFNENSLTERFQESTFFVIVVLCFLSSRRHRRTSPLAFLMGGFFLMAMIREFDAFLDHNVFDGAWQALVLAVIIGVGYRTYHRWRSLLETLPQFVTSYPFGIMITGMLITFAYSRLMGESILWQTLMEENYVRNVKNAVEESIELLGDTIILFGAMEFFLLAEQKNSRKPEEHAPAPKQQVQAHRL